MTYEQAVLVTGLLYGNILQRDSDEVGFKYHLDELMNGRLSVARAILKFYTSEEFIETFVVNQTPNELSHNLLSSFFGPKTFGAADVKETSMDLVQKGISPMLERLLRDSRFSDQHGESGIPRYTERPSQKAH